ncbi:unnamed protein product [Arctia plantaginis]|uniref:Uncharacterized protein n=1 Tax=Arctia plantaginis TaxID=874455 RepID=A0A8S0ZWG1_ARCPL|nr:unnamed protein product [Arctia plantaginis]
MWQATVYYEIGLPNSDRNWNQQGRGSKLQSVLPQLCQAAKKLKGPHRFRNWSCIPELNTREKLSIFSQQNESN